MADIRVKVPENKAKLSRTPRDREGSKQSSQLSPALLQQMTDAIVREIDPQQIILFGSQAQGTATRDSDVDLLIVEAEPFGTDRSRRREMMRVWRLLADFRIAKDILIYSSQEVEAWSNIKNHVIARALKEGQLLYERVESRQASTDNG